MSANDWQRIWSAFHAAMERPAEKRDDFLNQACDADIVSEVRSLLLAQSRAEGFLEQPAIDSSRGDDALIGSQVGSFRIEAVIGRGGMGSVYLAQDLSSLKRPVALKLIRRGMDSERIIARFEHERQTLAMMNHPNIASVYGAGSTSQGRPYFAMELVHGEPIDRYADARRLGTQARLALFKQLCAAVAHAHQKGVIHRDLKPSNILVTESDAGLVEAGPLVKVIDFGVAKAIAPGLDEATLYTEAGQIIGTPEYMSPEQAAGAGTALDTRTDVYSLGVVLYQLLVGALPFDSIALRAAGLIELQRVIRDSDPPTPSQRLRQLDPQRSGELARLRRTQPTQMARELRGELEWILLRAMAKEPERRYQTVAEFRLDIERYLSDQPVAAGPPDRLYRAGKFIRRHRLGVAVTLVILTMSLVFSFGLWRQVTETRAALAQAEAERERAQHVTEFLIDVFEESDPRQAQGREVSAREVLDRGSARLREQLDIEPDLRATLMGTVARVYQRLGLFEQSGQLQREALELWRSSAADDRAGTAEALLQLSIVERELGHLDEAEALQREALDLHLAEGGEWHADVARSRNLLGIILRAKGEHDAAEQQLLLAQSVQARLGESIEPGARAAVSNTLAGVSMDRGDYDAAEAHYRDSLTIRTEHEPDNALQIALARNNLSSVLIRKGDYAAAESQLRDTVDTYRRVLGDDHPDTGTALNNLAVSINQQGRAEEALPYLQEALAIRVASLGPEHPEVAVARYNIGRALIAIAQPAAAIAEYQPVLAIFRRVHGPDHARIAIVQNALAHAQIALNALNDAEVAVGDAHRIGLQRWPEGHEILADSLAIRAELAFRSAQLDDAADHAEAALAMLSERLEDGDWRIGAVRSVLGAVRAAQGDHAEARRLLEAAHTSLSRQFGDSDPRVSEALTRLREIQ